MLGLRSRWTMPRACAAPSASATRVASRTASPIAERPAREAGCEVLAVEPLHGEEQLAGGGLAVGDVADDAGVDQLGEQLDLALEALGALLAPDRR